MTISNTSADESRRQETLRRYAVLDTPPEQALDDLTALAAQICEAPIALVSLVDGHRQWFKAKVGLEMEETPREVSFCTHALQQKELFIVPDATLDARFAANPMVTGPPGIRFYAGAPLVTPEGVVLGALCVMDRVARTLTEKQQEAVRVLARQAMTHLELHRQTRELTGRERLLHTIFDAEPQCVKLFGVDGSLRMMNRAGLEIIEADSYEAVAGRCVYPLVVPEQRAAFEALTERVFQGESGSLDYELVGLKGTRRWLETSMAPLYDEHGAVTDALGVTRDITKRKRAEEALRKSEEHFRTLFDYAPDGILIIGADGRYIDANPSICRMLGYTREELIGLQPEDLVASVEIPRLEPALAEIKAGADYHHEWQFRRKDGSIFTVEAMVTVMPDGNLLGMLRDATERNRRKTEALHLAAIVESTDAAIIGKDLNRVITSWNRGAEKIFGYTAAEMVGTSSMRIVPADQQGEEHQIMAKIARGEHQENFETVRKTKAGQMIHVSVTASSIRNAAGEVVGGSRVMRDISERKRVEAVLRRQAYLLDVSFDAVIVWELDGPIIYWNQGAAEFYGYSPEEAMGRRIHDLLQTRHPAGLAAFEHELRRDGVWTNELRHVTREGRAILVESRQQLVQDLGAQSVVFETNRDITERKRMEARFRRLIESNAQGVMFWNTRGEITGANDAFLSILGYSREDLEAGLISWSAISPPEFAALDQHAMEEMATKGASTPYERDYLRKDGSRVPLLSGAAAFEDNPEEGVCFVVDLTERKKLEERSLRNQRMESIGTLAGGIAHDLNNALAPIIISLDLLKMKFTDADSQELLSIIGSSAQRGSDMVRQVLSFARGVEGRRMEVQVHHLIREIQKIANDTFLKNIEMRAIIPEDLWTVVGDPTQLHQVLLNLCVNARDAMPSGGTLTLTAENVTLDAQYAGLNPEARPGPYVFLHVEDNGTGMPPEVIEKIFDPFFTTKEVGKGTGLGLSTSLAIVKSHGGFVRVYSEPGKGTRFTVHLPAQTQSAGDAEERPAEMARGNGELILVVDDEDIVRQITQQTLEAFGYRVILAADGAEAVALFAAQGEEVAAVVTDMTMPVMDGAATIHVLRKINPEVRIVAVSGLATNVSVAHAAGLGVKHFLPKPYTAETLLKALKQVLTDES